MPLIEDGQRNLNNIVVYNCRGNTFNSGVYSCTFASSMQNSVINGGNYILVSGCGSSTFDNIRSVTLIGVSSCNFGNGGQRWIGYSTSNVTTGSTCFDLNMGNNLATASIGSGSSSLTFGNYCANITTGVGCNTITFGTYCNYVRIGNLCNTISMSNYYRFIEIGDNCSRITMNTSSGSTSNYVQFVTIGKNISNLTIAPTRKLSYETIYYKNGRTETAV